jgi:acetyl esterase/lipase
MRALSPLLATLALLTSCSSLPTVSVSNLPPGVTAVQSNGWWILSPASVVPKTTGFLFYPGGFVKPEAYLNALSPLAAAGWVVAVPTMPFDLAFFDVDKGLQVSKVVPGPRRWVVGGHSLGGVAAALAVKKSPGRFVGLVFWAAYAPESADLSGTEQPVLSITGSDDGLSTPAKVAAADRFLPVGTEHFAVEGANHAQFADYGSQRGDGVAKITPETQHSLVAEATRKFLEKWDSAP